MKQQNIYAYFSTCTVIFPSISFHFCSTARKNQCLHVLQVCFAKYSFKINVQEMFCQQMQFALSWLSAWCTKYTRIKSKVWTWTWLDPEKVRWPKKLRSTYSHNFLRSTEIQDNNFKILHCCVLRSRKFIGLIHIWNSGNTYFKRTMNQVWSGTWIWKFNVQSYKCLLNILVFSGDSSILWTIR